jgi:hypothetical protein
VILKKLLGCLLLSSLGACATQVIDNSGRPADSRPEDFAALPTDMVGTLRSAQQTSPQFFGNDGCATCYDAVSGSADPLCTANGPPSSSQILQDLMSCICTNGCAAECGDACDGTSDAASDACMTCIETTCYGSLETCYADVGDQPDPVPNPNPEPNPEPNPDPDPPPPVSGCASCGDYLTGVSSADPCMDDGPPSSAQLLEDVSQCICVTGCSAECGTACDGSDAPSDACYDCIYSTCEAPLEACAGGPIEPGGGGGDPPPPPPANTCSTCGDFISGHASEWPCTDDGPPSSMDLYDSLMDCICVTDCSTECGAACNGGEDISDVCSTCINITCNPAIQACLGQ